MYIMLNNGIASAFVRFELKRQAKQAEQDPFKNGNIV